MVTTPMDKRGYDGRKLASKGGTLDKQIAIQRLDSHYLDAAIEMAVENYMLERRSTAGLSEGVNRNYFMKQLEELFQRGTGRMAFVDNEPVGFLAFSEILTVDKSGTKGATSPLFAYGIRHSKRGEIIGRLFQSVATELCENFAQSLRVFVYAHDAEVLWTYLMSSFAMEMTGVVRDVSLPIEAEIPETCSLREIGHKELVDHKLEVIELYRALINHLRMSPVFYHCRQYLPVEKRFDDFLRDDLRVFALFDGGRLVGMVDSEPVGYGFAAHDQDALGMGDIFIAPGYREGGLAAALLKFAIDRLKIDGLRRLFVTHGTINPTARGFWDKYFTNYSYSMTRKIDPDMLGSIKPV